MEALYHAHFHRWDYRRLTYSWWSSLINDVATSHNIDALMDRHPLPVPVPTHPYMPMQPTGHEENKRARTTLAQSPTRPSKHADNPEASVLVPFSRPLVPFSCTTRGGQMESTLSDTTRGGHSSTTVREAVRMIYQRRTLLTNNNYTNLP